MSIKCPRTNVQSRGSCTADLSPWEKQLLALMANVAISCLYFAHNCTERTPRLLPSGSKAMPRPTFSAIWGMSDFTLYRKDTCSSSLPQNHIFDITHPLFKTYGMELKGMVPREPWKSLERGCLWWVTWLCVTPQSHSDLWPHLHAGQNVWARWASLPACVDNTLTLGKCFVTVGQAWTACM